MIVCLILMCVPAPTSNSQAVPDTVLQIKKIDTENVKLVQKVYENQQAIRDKLETIQTQTKPKVVYIKIFEKQPRRDRSNYMAVERTKLQLIGIDTFKLKLRPLHAVDSIAESPPVLLPCVHRPSFIYRLFHHKKRKQ